MCLVSGRISLVLAFGDINCRRSQLPTLTHAVQPSIAQRTTTPAHPLSGKSLRVDFTKLLLVDLLCLNFWQFHTQTEILYGIIERNDCLLVISVLVVRYLPLAVHPFSLA